jgi:hypothetical protein
MIAGAVQLAIVAFSLQSPSISQAMGGKSKQCYSVLYQAGRQSTGICLTWLMPLSPTLAAMLLGIAGNTMKQNAIYPPPQDPDYATEEEAGRGECCLCFATGGPTSLVHA